MVSFSSTVDVREYERILDVNASSAFVGLAIGWSYNTKTTGPKQPRSGKRRLTSDRLPALNPTQRLDLMEEYGASDYELEAFWRESRENERGSYGDEVSNWQRPTMRRTASRPIASVFSALIPRTSRSKGISVDATMRGIKPSILVNKKSLCTTKSEHETLILIQYYDECENMKGTRKSWFRRRDASLAPAQ